MAKSPSLSETKFKKKCKENVFVWNDQRQRYIRNRYVHSKIVHRKWCTKNTSSCEEKSKAASYTQKCHLKNAYSHINQHTSTLAVSERMRERPTNEKNDKSLRQNPLKLSIIIIIYLNFTFNHSSFTFISFYLLY